MTNEITVNLNQMLQDLIDALHFTKTTPSSTEIVETLEGRLYAAHDRLITRFAAARQATDVPVVVLPDDTLTEFDAIRCDILHHAQCWLDDRRSDDDW
jgi:hypothetical protein